MRFFRTLIRLVRMIKRLFIISQLLLASQLCFAQSIFMIDSVPPAYRNISKYINYYEDPNGDISFEEARSDTFQNKFKPYQNNRKFNNKSTYWAKITFKSNLKNAQEWVFYAGTNNHIEVFTPENKGFRTQKAGYLDPASEKSGAGLASFGIKFNLNPGEIKTLYVRAYNINHSQVKFNTHLINPETWLEYTSKENRNLIQGIFQGILWIMILYNIFLFFINRDKTYLYYTAYMVGLSIYFLNIHDFFTDSPFAIFQESPKMTWYISTAVNISAIFYVQFIRRFLNLDQLLPKWDKISRFIIIGFIILVFFKLGVLLTTFNIPVINMVMQSLLLIGSLFSLMLVIYLFRTGDKVARFFIAGTFFLVVAMLISALSYIRQGGFSFDYFNYLQVGVVIEIVLFSLGLGYRMKVNELEKRTAQSELINQLTENERIQKRATSELEHKVLERTAQILDKNAQLERRNEEILNQRDLLEKQKEEIEEQRDRLETINLDLKQLNNEKNHLMSIVAHDLRNPLGSAMSVTDLMREDKDTLTEDQQEYVGLLKRTLNRMNEMVQKILEIRKVESNQLSINLQKVNTASLVRQVVGSFKSESEKKNIKIHVNAVDASANLDPVYFTQILENLVSNALKFSPPEKNIFICTLPNEKAVHVKIKDEGPGLTKKDMTRMFGKFQRLSAKPTNGESSIGIGLSIVKKYTEAMGGKVWCESEHGNGAEFILEFELLKEPVNS